MRNLTPAQRRALLEALHEEDRDYYPYAPDRNPGGLIGTLAAILVFLALVTATIFAIRSGLAQRILFPPAPPVVVPSVQPTAVITVPTPRPLPPSNLQPLPPYVPQPQAPAPAVVEQAPIVEHGARANTRSYESQPTQESIVIYPTATAQPGGVNWSSDVHVGSDGLSLNAGISITNDPTPVPQYRANSMPEAVQPPNARGSRENEHPIGDKGSRPNTRGYK